ncbi:hypothetical protein [Flavobacterium flavipallidum]|uniref:Adenylosuccinate lyase n=1 Tax=Flavobacterium flavipallidum TaxID=3139140 RepID=A0ABU9HJF3_9FLAO
MENISTLINLTNGSKSSRDAAADFILSRPDLHLEFIHSCYEINNPDHHKACWILEIIAIRNVNWLKEFLEIICTNTQKLSNESAIRPLSKVLFLLIESHYKSKKNGIQLTQNQLQQLIETNFDWMITETKVAAKAHAMRSLFLLGKEFDWIHPELKIILSKDYSKQSTAYKAVARQLLKKIK